MTRLIHVAVALALTLPLATQAHDTSRHHSAGKHHAAVQNDNSQESPVDFSVSEIRTSAKIVELNKQNRVAVLRTPQNKLVSVQVPRSVRNFDQIQVGDDLVIRYKVATAVDIQPAAKNGIREVIESTDTKVAKPNSLPGIETDRTVEILATIDAINHKANTMTLRGATRTVTVAIPRNLNIGKLAVGDEVHAVINDAIIVDVENAAKQL